MLIHTHTHEYCLGTIHKDVRLNPKAIRAQEMYGEMDALSGEWTTGTRR